MKTVAIITEYNPFHKGHLYQIEQIKACTGADFVLVIMSGNFVQRGAPALCNKYLRAEMALSNGIDLVIELPTFYALSSAELFAEGAVSILSKLGCVDYLCFGSESGDLTPLQEVAALLLEESTSYKEVLQQHLKAGSSFPSARMKALTATMDDTRAAYIKETLCKPNNILGIEYCKALLKHQSLMQPITIQRTGAQYHDTDLQVYSSASAIRNALSTSANSDCIKEHMPPSVFDLLLREQLLSATIHADDFSTLLHYRFIQESNGFSSYLDCTDDFSDKIIKNIEKYTTLSEFIFLLKSKDMTLTRINRILFHILLNIKKEQTAISCTMQHAPYARILGFRKNSSSLLGTLMKQSSIPIITKPADFMSLLSMKQQLFFNQDVQAAHIYEAVASQVQHKAKRNEYRQPLVIL